MFPILQAVQLFSTNVTELKERAQGKRLIIFFHGYPAAGKTTTIKKWIRDFQLHHKHNVFVIDPDDRHGILKGEVPPKVGKDSMRKSIGAFAQVLLNVTNGADEPIVVADAGDNQGMRDTMVYMALAICVLWNSLAATLRLRKYEIYIHHVLVETPWWVALCRNMTRSRQVDPTLFFDAVRGVGMTFEEMKSLGHSWEKVENGLSSNHLKLEADLYEAKQCSFNYVPPAFGRLMCSGLVMKWEAESVKCHLGWPFHDNQVVLPQYCQKHRVELFGRKFKFPIRN